MFVTTLQIKNNAYKDEWSKRMLHIGFSILLKKDWTEIVHIHFPTALGYSLHIYHDVHSTLINISDVYSNIYI